MKVPATHCGRGHELTPENAYFRPDGRRECRLCRRERQLRYRLTPEYRESELRYRLTPEYRDKRRKIRRTAEYRERHRIYSARHYEKLMSTTDGRAQRRMYWNRHERAVANRKDIDRLLLLAKQNPWIHTIPELKELVDGT